jgi:hypothetical protein
LIRADIALQRSENKFNLHPLIAPSDLHSPSFTLPHRNRAIAHGFLHTGLLVSLEVLTVADTAIFVG